MQESFIAKDYSGSKINYGLESRDKGSEHEGRASGLEERPGEVTKAWRASVESKLRFCPSSDLGWPLKHPLTN